MVLIGAERLEDQLPFLMREGWLLCKNGRCKRLQLDMSLRKGHLNFLRSLGRAWKALNVRLEECSSAYYQLYQING